MERGFVWSGGSQEGFHGGICAELGPPVRHRNRTESTIAGSRGCSTRIGVPPSCGGGGSRGNWSEAPNAHGSILACSGQVPTARGPSRHQHGAAVPSQGSQAPSSRARRRAPHPARYWCSRQIKRGGFMQWRKHRQRRPDADVWTLSASCNASAGALYVDRVDREPCEVNARAVLALNET